MGRKNIQMQKKAKGYRRKMLKRREAKVFEDPKLTLCLRGHKTSQTIVSVLRDLSRIKRPFSRMLSKHNAILPFEPGGEASLEFLCNKNEAALFAMGTHTKKRPDNLMLGRIFDEKLLDIVELGVQDFVSLDEAALHLPKGSATMRVGSKPLLIFQGDQWEHGGEVMERLRNLLLDFFNGAEPKHITLSGVDHVITVTALGGGAEQPRIKLRHYHVELSRSKIPSAAPQVTLHAIGASMDLSVRRSQIAPDTLWKDALRVPRQARPKKQKNVSRDEWGDKRGRVYLQKQNLDNLQVKKMKALRSSPGEDENEAGERAED